MSNSKIPSHIIAKFEKEAEVEFFELHACLTGDCPHWHSKHCLTDAFVAGRKREYIEAQGLVEALTAVKSLMSGAPSIAPMTDKYVLELVTKTLRQFESATHAGDK